MSGAEQRSERSVENAPAGTRAEASELKPRVPAAGSAADDFARQAEQAPPGLLAEFWDFLVHNKKWWLTPIILVLLLATAFVLLSGTAVAPFIYPGL